MRCSGRSARRPSSRRRSSRHRSRRAARVIPFPRRYRYTALAAAAVAACALFGLGYLAGGGGGNDPLRTVAMSGANQASGQLAVFEKDAAGNWPMELRVSGLAPGRVRALADAGRQARRAVRRVRRRRRRDHRSAQCAVHAEGLRRLGRRAIRRHDARAQRPSPHGTGADGVCAARRTCEGGRRPFGRRRAPAYFLPLPLPFPLPLSLPLVMAVAFPLAFPFPLPFALPFALAVPAALAGPAGRGGVGLSRLILALRGLRLRGLRLGGGERRAETHRVPVALVGGQRVDGDADRHLALVTDGDLLLAGLVLARRVLRLARLRQAAGQPRPADRGEDEHRPEGDDRRSTQSSPGYALSHEFPSLSDHRNGYRSDSP